MTPLIREMVKMVSAVDFDPVDLQWFDLSGYVNDQSHAVTEPLMTHRPPFEKNIVVWRGKTRSHESYDTIFMVVGNDPQEGVLVTMWKGPTGKQPQRFPTMVYLVEGDMLRYGSMDDGVELEKDVAELMLAYVGNWLESLSLRNEAYVPVVQQTFTNRRKMAQGKTPTYDWTTVIVEPVKPRQENQGGTHASPRLHDRRGHLRRLQNGKTCWVKPHKVGDASKGTVFHDYAIKEKNA